MSMQNEKYGDLMRTKINIAPEIDDDIDESGFKDRLLEMQLKMATSSINHEYARIEYDETADRERKEELLEFMGDCRRQYFDARTTLEGHDPYALADFEADLLKQKQSTISCHTV